MPVSWTRLHRHFQRRLRSQRMMRASNTSAVIAGTTRLATAPPAASSRSISSAIGGAPAAQGLAGLGLPALGMAAALPAARPLAAAKLAPTVLLAAPGRKVATRRPVRGRPAARGFCSGSPANWLMILPPTSSIRPRPNWAGLPVTIMSVATVTAVPSPFSARLAWTVAVTVPWPVLERHAQPVGHNLAPRPLRARGHVGKHPWRPRPFQWPASECWRAPTSSGSISGAQCTRDADVCQRRQASSEW